MSTSRGKFITFEGLDGTGKSTQIAKLARALRARGYSVVVTREPGGTATGEKIRHVILDSATTSLDSMAEMALMFASRAQHIAEIIEPALAAGKIVLCDRFTDSTEAYQGGGRKLGSKPVLALHRILCRDLLPDLTILLDFDKVFGSVDAALDIVTDHTLFTVLKNFERLDATLLQTHTKVRETVRKKLRLG